MPISQLEKRLLQVFSDTTCENACPEMSYYSFLTGKCEKCPFGTYWKTEDSPAKCCLCDQFHERTHLMSETYYYGAYLDQCIEYNDRYVSYTSDDLTFKVDMQPYDIPRESRHQYEVDLEAQFDVCHIIRTREHFRDFCNEEYDMSDMSFMDITGFDMTQLVCVLEKDIDEVFNDNCGHGEHSWPDVENFYWLDAACLVVDHALQAERAMVGRSCEEVDPTLRFVNMPFHLGRGFTSDLNWGSILIPLLEPIERMEMADFGAVTKTVMAMMQRFGMYNVAEITGLPITNHLRNLIIEVPENLKLMSASLHMPLLTEEGMSQVFCENGNVRKDCRDACSIPINQCWKDEDVELTCSSDPCNNCLMTYTRVDNGEEYGGCRLEGEKLCSAVNDEYETENIELIVADPENEGGILYAFKCPSGRRLQPSDDSEYQDCRNNDMRGVFLRCDANNDIISDRPSCDYDGCSRTFPENGPENGFIREFGAPANSWCRWVEMACNPGFELRGESVMYCDGLGNWGPMPSCVESSCPDEETTIQNGKLINDLVEGHMGGDMSWYRCNPRTPRYRYDRDYFAAPTCGENIMCEEDEGDKCPPHIPDGYKVREWRQLDEYGNPVEPAIFIAEYRCDTGAELRDNEKFAGDKERHGWAECPENGMDILPVCERPEKDCGPDPDAPCKMPQIPNGRLVQEFLDDNGMVTHGLYVCNNDFMMIETPLGSGHGFCREKGWRGHHTYELPQCVRAEDWVGFEFELVGSRTKIANAGRVKVRKYSAAVSSGSASDWMGICDDDFNKEAAGAICRSMGFVMGRAVEPNKKMKPVEGLHFGMTGFWCMDDDSYATRFVTFL